LAYEDAQKVIDTFKLVEDGPDPKFAVAPGSPPLFPFARFKKKKTTTPHHTTQQPDFGVLTESIEHIKQKNPEQSPEGICEDIIRMHLIALQMRKRRFENGVCDPKKAPIFF